MRPIGWVLVATLALAHATAWSQGEGKAGSKAAKQAARSALAFTPEREAAALAFVRRHHPELATLLHRLKPMNQDEYERAIVELFATSENLAGLLVSNPKRHDAALEVWKARSRVDLITARLASGAPAPEVESQLRQALEAQLDAEVRQHRLDREQAEARLKRIDESIARIEANRGKMVESRLHGLKKKGERARRPVAKAAPPPSSSSSRPSPGDRQ